MNAVKRLKIRVLLLSVISGCALENPSSVHTAADVATADGSIADSSLDINVVDVTTADATAEDTPLPDVDLSDAMMSDVNTADTTFVDSSELDAVLPDAELPDAELPDVTASDVIADAQPSDGNTPDVGTPDVGTPDVGTPDVGTPDVGTPDVGTPDVGTPDAGTPDVGTPDVGTPDVGTPDVGTPDVGTPDVGTPDAGSPSWSLQLAQSQQSSRVGGGSGDFGRENLNCGAAALMTGIGVRSTRYVNELSARCAPLRADGSLGATNQGNWEGGNDGNRTTRDCPSGQVVVGFSGRAGSIVDNLRVWCAPLRSWVLTSGTPMALPANGGDGGMPFDNHCTAGWVMTGMAVRIDLFDVLRRISAFSSRCTPITH